MVRRICKEDASVVSEVASQVIGWFGLVVCSCL
ncbi:hypothetical protein FOQG_00126 [Fusarium oxysporum f. sp. raphani 54005]|uniref:Uncharacterized protein n=6 Tax=Fusarium oxysporum TaxID=5507 RepID=X0CZX5_FUSOX|nr:hypothetical protein FOXG_18099 [Fusarium oxysporum f. sp. lycopersici 4287]EXA50937.1 hypothetical protein FOVG_03445 [Fusarium oxysporum f. sp. pisi HDV247]EXK43076.1 hypothetical protein FOMG_05757 [Fusarium oxysporum f. sp. melonis 26406]EXK99676.1 hypothetical protein FOQG_00126 [Fusarium oxysporum f. sp. raphani 54005]EXL63013.1 hypothetical protein FOCG_01415 [Fusarium oxysporum f. sp. radicis-lycopersici 26381]EXL79645.1 hypothetical protein FOPG_06446 [Fusarium oxysporum f. sp. con